MNQNKLARIIKLLRENGVSHLKTLELEIHLSDGQRPFIAPEPDKVAPATEASAPPVANEIPHHENEVRNLLKLSDADLVDKIFPMEGGEQAPGNA